MKQKIVLLVVTTGLLAGLAACGSSSGEVKQASSVDANVDAAVSENVESAEEEAEVSGFSGSVTLEETEIYNANGISVTAVDIDPNSVWGVEIGLLITNDSDQDVTVVTRNLVVNGYNLESSGLYAEVAAGKSDNDELTLYSSELDECGISTVAEIGFDIRVEDSSTWETIDTSDRITLETSAAGEFTQPVDDSGDVIYDDNGIRVICKGIKDDSIWDGELVFYVENNTDRSVSVYGEDISVNGYMEDASFWADLWPGTMAVDGMYLYGLEDLGLESLDDVSEIEFKLRIIDEDTWEEIDTSDPITLHFDSEE